MGLVRQRHRAQRLLLLSLIALATQGWLLVKMVEPEQDRQFDTRTFVHQVEALRADAPGTLVFVKLGRDTWAIRYMMNLDHDEIPTPRFIAQPDLARLANLPHPAWVIVARSERGLLDGTPLQGLAPAYSGRLNGNALLVFKAP